MNIYEMCSKSLKTERLVVNVHGDLKKKKKKKTPPTESLIKFKNLCSNHTYFE